jgi:hypothetical protein
MKTAHHLLIAFSSYSYYSRVRLFEGVYKIVVRKAIQIRM